ncbi:hypothetical protein BDW71DRAFT_177679 [Aspergillus fruticulosus]
MATALWAVLCAPGIGRIRQRLGDILGFCGWLPFANQVEDITQHERPKIADPPGSDAVPGKSRLQHLVSDFFVRTIGVIPILQADALSILTTPVMLGHGPDDAWVPVELGHQAVQILREVMGEIDVEWMEYFGAEGEGHWVKEPEGFDRILSFLETDAEDETSVEPVEH